MTTDQCTTVRQLELAAGELAVMSPETAWAHDSRVRVQVGHVVWVVAEDGTATRRWSRQLPTAKRLEVFRRDGYKCKRCGSTIGLTIDHIRPKSEGGTDALSNLQALCNGCNRKKAADFGIRERFERRHANRKRWV